MERSFNEIVDDLDAGEVTARLTDKLKECVRGALKSQEASTLTLKLKITPDGRTFIVTNDIKVDIKVPKTALTVFYARDDGELVKDDPKQTALPLRTVPRDPTPLRSPGHQPEAKTE